MSAAKHTPGEWEVDAVRNEGEYGNNGPDTRSGFDSYAILDSEGRVLFDSLNRDGSATEVDEECDDDYFHAWDAKAKADAWRVVNCVNTHDDLLAALIGLLEIEEERIRLGFFTPNSSGAQRIEAARAAIAKATGSTAA